MKTTHSHIAQSIDSSSTYFKNHSTYCTLKVMSCLKEVVSETTWEGKREFFDKAVSGKGIHPHLSPDDYAKGVESMLAISLAQIPDKFRKRAERKIRAYDLSQFGEMVHGASQAAQMAQRRLKVVGEFADKYPGHTRSSNLIRRAHEQDDQIASDILQHKDVPDETLKSLYFGKGAHHSIEGISSTLNDNHDVQKMLGSLMRSYDDYVNELAIGAGMTPVASSVAIKTGKISLWSRVKEKVGTSVGIALNVAKQAAAVLAIGMLGMSSLQMDKTMDQPQVSPEVSSSVVYSLPDGVSINDLGDSMGGSKESTEGSASLGVDTSVAETTTGEISPDLSTVIIRHVVEEGDNAWSIARSHLEDITGSSVANQAVVDLLERSGLDDKHRVLPGEAISLAMNYQILETSSSTQPSP